MTQRKKVSDPAQHVDVLFRHPGFLLRRAHQVAVSSFVKHYGDVGVTSTQLGILKVVQRWPGIDQVSVGRVLGLDRTTATTCVTTLGSEKMLERRRDPEDHRRRALFITPAGEKVIEKIGDTSASAEAMLAVFSDDEASTFMNLLEHFVRSHNDSIRIPMEAPVANSTGARDVVPRGKYRRRQASV
jgi:DNA-binding MarR family transcriptional regulator